jgi:hypothetical protein
MKPMPAEMDKKYNHGPSSKTTRHKMHKRGTPMINLMPKAPETGAGEQRFRKVKKKR